MNRPVALDSPRSPVAMVVADPAVLAPDLEDGPRRDRMVARRVEALTGQLAGHLGIRVALLVQGVQPRHELGVVAHILLAVNGGSQPLHGEMPAYPHDRDLDLIRLGAPQDDSRDQTAQE